MFELINKLKKMKKQLLEQKITNEPTIQEPQEPEVDIVIMQINNFYKIEISDYISIGDYENKMKLNDLINGYDLYHSVSISVLWNGREQKVNKGIYYVIKENNSLYNIRIGEHELKIDERIKIDDITKERIIYFDTYNKKYQFTSFKHNKFGSTFYTKYYHTNGFKAGNLELSPEETYDEVNSVLANLEMINGIENIIDINLFRNNVLDDLSNTISQKTL